MYVFTPPPVRGMGFCFCSISFFVSLFVSLSATLRENGWTDLHEIFREGVEWPWDDLIHFWVNSGKRVGGSKVMFFVITGHSSESHFHSLGGSRGLALTSQLHRWQQGSGLLCPAPQLVQVLCSVSCVCSLWLIVLPVSASECVHLPNLCA